MGGHQSGGAHPNTDPACDPDWDVLPPRRRTFTQAELDRLDEITRQVEQIEWESRIWDLACEAFYTRPRRPRRPLRRLLTVRGLREGARELWEAACDEPFCALIVVVVCGPVVYTLARWGVYPLLVDVYHAAARLAHALI